MPYLAEHDRRETAGVQMAGGVLDGAAQQRLPTSATCVNLLKLPPYQAQGVLRDKMLLAVRNASGFDLS